MATPATLNGLADVIIKPDPDPEVCCKVVTGIAQVGAHKAVAPKKARE